MYVLLLLQPADAARRRRVHRWARPESSAGACPWMSIIGSARAFYGWNSGYFRRLIRDCALHRAA